MQPSAYGSQEEAQTEPRCRPRASGVRAAVIREPAWFGTRAHHCGPAWSSRSLVATIGAERATEDSSSAPLPAVPVMHRNRLRSPTPFASHACAGRNRFVSSNPAEKPLEMTQCMLHGGPMHVIARQPTLQQEVRRGRRPIWSIGRSLYFGRHRWRRGRRGTAEPLRYDRGSAPGGAVLQSRHREGNGQIAVYRVDNPWRIVLFVSAFALLTHA